MEKGDGRAPVGVGLAAENVPPDDGQRVRQQRRHVRMLGDVLLVGAAHEPPAPDVSPARQKREKSALHLRLPSGRKSFEY